MSQRRKFDKAFKLMTVELCLWDKSTTEVAAKLGLRPQLVSRWKREYEQRKEGSFSGHGKPALSAEQAEIARLKKQLLPVSTGEFGPLPWWLPHRWGVNHAQTLSTHQRLHTLRNCGSGDRGICVLR